MLLTINMNEAVDAVAAGSPNPRHERGSRAVFSNRLRSPDVIATSFQNAAWFEPQTHAAACWLSTRCGAQLENIHDQLCLDARQEDQLIRELTAAGFKVLKQRI